MNAARIFGIDHEIGSLEVGQARRHRAVGAEVLRHQARGGVQGRVPRLVGDGRVERVADDLRAAHLPAAVGRVRACAKQALSVTFMAQAAIDDGVPGRLGLRKRLRRPRGTRARYEARPALERRAAGDHGRSGDVPRRGRRRALHLRADGARARSARSTSSSDGRRDPDRRGRAGRLGQDAAGRAAAAAAARGRAARGRDHERPRHDRGRRAPAGRRADRARRSWSASRRALVRTPRSARTRR